MVGGVLVDTGPLRRHRNFRRLWGGQFVSQVGTQRWLLPGMWRYDSRRTGPGRAGRTTGDAGERAEPDPVG